MNEGYALRATILAKGGLLEMMDAAILNIAELKENTEAVIAREEIALLTNKRFCAMVMRIYFNFPYLVTRENIFG